jgi:hypothetical protein
MLKKIFGPLLIAILLTLAATSSLAVVKGLVSVRESIVRVGENIVIPQGASVKSVVSVGGSVTVYGQVAEDVVAIGGSVFLKDTALVGGDTVAVGGRIMREPGALAKGEIVEVSAAGVSPAVSYFTKGGLLQGILIFRLMTFAGFVILAVILVALFMPQLGRVSGVLEGDLLRNFLTGLLIALAFVPIIIVLAVSLIGIVLIPVWVILVGAAGLFGYIAVSHVLGKKTLHAFRLMDKSMMTETIVGIVLLSIVGLVPVGGLIVKMIAVLCGLGGVYATRFGTRY